MSKSTPLGSAKAAYVELTSHSERLSKFDILIYDIVLRILPDEIRHRWLFQEMYSMRPKMGNASKVLNLMNKIADKHNIEISLIAEPYDNDGRRVKRASTLVRIYSRYGFVKNPDSRVENAMIRYPNSQNVPGKRINFMSWLRR